MEVNIENAFLFAVKFSIGPIVSSLDVAAGKIQELIYRQTFNILEKPLVSTLVISWVFVLMITTITLSMIITAGVLCVVVVIIVVEGFALGMIICLTATVTASSFAAVIIVIGLVLAYKTKE